MFKKAEKGYYEFQNFKKFKDLIHGFSTREFGDCRAKMPENWKNIEKFLRAFGLKKEDLVLGEQTHGNKIKVVNYNDRGKIVPAVDGLLTRDWQLVLGVRSADCLPILFFEPEVKIVGAAHAGWQGILARLPQKMIDQIIRMGGIPENVLVGIGPHICGKCYSVEKNRTQQFLAEFGNLGGMVRSEGEKNWLELEIPTVNQLVHSGVKWRNIFFAGVCTACQNKDFFSYRKDSKKTYGEMLSVICLKR